ncbi:MAG: hypothetical protein K2W96_21020, partial [Gemmataceae bacterium]|nr:hypothetical protein [Gemmataceae bacterium]
MTRDPFYRQIIAGLSGRLDPELFERCAADLLRSAYPGLAPVRGGSDGGMDGACPDGEGEAFPLVTTTGEDVVGNLRKSLRSYKDTGGRRRRAVFATSRELTAERRRALQAAAGKQGFTLVNIHTQGAMADLLYRCPAWCLELLGLPGDPPPLSALPLPGRPSTDAPLVGRADDLAWLRDAEGDLVLSAQPGMGKTALLAALAREGLGLFVATQDAGRVVAGLRESGPPALLVEDAHLDSARLRDLRRLRVETGLRFRIVADCWPGGKDEVAHALGITDASVRELGPLTR